MALSIKDHDTDRLVRRYAQIKGLSYTRAIRVAVSDALDRESAILEGRSFSEQVKHIQRRVAAFPRDATISADDIIGYDEHGVPR